ncbi:MAG: ATP-binding cassette domain-containing protein [Thermogemmatispora sp.]|jgi:ABC-2 type transport system ATP-binding protein|uniref:Multidrug ABC transporter ATP-binding protein n=2 Tax=Thermogemmatispora TaxID=768669 RepID=A0A328VKD5_9CHLR|nr:ATP-binding cassette domain-containing protein [Thermogemmatispora aurantia]MBE3566241.1 ATP-binding cassette domain-containing protein [Thermogemmatispora sp.]MBX5457455.1 ATP-binding cassette domain-containing protein [Thermogemmatispora sp.]RAQ97381.1 multidrug ABC transporter ATP-binding protein [Thermogemmatispora tikiterensis]
MRPMIEVEDLVKRFGDKVAVDHITFSIQEGEAFGLLGPNGAGKTTTIRMLITLIPPTSGQMRIAGLDVQRHKMVIRRLLGYVSQSLSADSTLTGYENLLVVAKLLGFPRQERERRIWEVLELLNLRDAAHSLVRTYSGGMVRRLEIGQAILHRPRILILDEPTIGLDPTARRSVWEALELLRNQEQITLLVTTHYMEEADAYCQRVAIMDQGRIAAIGEPAALKASLNRPGATLEDVFTSVTGNTLESGGSYREVRQLRRRAQRFG